MSRRSAVHYKEPHMEVLALSGPVLKPKEATLRTSATLPKRVWEALEKIGAEEGYTRDEVMVEFLEWAIREWKAKPKQGGKGDGHGGRE